MNKKWRVMEDDTHYKEMRQVGPRQFQFITITDMIDAGGKEFKNEPWGVELGYVDLDEIPSDAQKSACDCCDMNSWFPPHEGPGHEPPERTLERDIAVAQCCHDYGCKAPLGSWMGKSRREFYREARRTANELLNNRVLKKKLENSVNKIGSTALEYMRGDTFSALERGVEAGEPSARLMAKIHGVPQNVIDDARPKDWLPYLTGYMNAVHTEAVKPLVNHSDISPEYFRGFERGVRVRKGEAPAPGWIQTKTGG